MMLKPVLLGVLLPAVLCGAWLILAWRPWRRDESITGGAWGGAIGFGMGYLIAHTAAVGWPPLRPVDVTQWLPYVAVAAAGLGLVESLGMMNRWLRWGFRFSLSAAAVWLLLRPMFEYRWTVPQGALWLIVLAMAMFITWMSLDTLARQVRGACGPLTILIVAGGGGIVLVVSKVASLGQLSGAVAAMAGASLVVTWWNGARSLAPGATAVVTILLGYLWLEGYLYGEVPALSAVLLAAAPTAAWIGNLPRVRRLADWQAVSVRAAAVTLPTLIAVALAVAASGFGEEYPY